MRRQKLGSCLLSLLLLTLCAAWTKPVQGAHVSARGGPGSQEFGFAALVYPDGSYLAEALQMAHDLRLDWLIVPVDWSAIQPASSSDLRLKELDRVMQFASERQMAVMVSISRAPAWGMLGHGPDPMQTAQLVSSLALRYPAVQAVELFPGANTVSGWGSRPDAAAYTLLLSSVSKELAQANCSVFLAAGGLRPLQVTPSSGDVDDLVFLQSLYDNGAAQWMPVVSVQYLDLTGDPLQPASRSERRVFRHYEEVRQVMAANNHQKGRIWITYFRPPSGKIESSDPAFLDPTTQSDWVNQAYIQARGQLYIGAAALQSLNPGLDSLGRPGFSLIESAGSVHPFRPVLKQIIEQNQAGSPLSKPGQPKEGNFGKFRP